MIVRSEATAPAPTAESWLHTRDAVERSAAAVRERWSGVPVAAIILGTGLGRLAEQMEVEVAIGSFWRSLGSAFVASFCDRHRRRHALGVC